MYNAYICKSVSFLTKDSNMEKDRTLNLLGALALRMTDLMNTAVKTDRGLGGETAAALVTLGADPGISINVLRQILHLSHPGTVRLVDRLEVQGLVERRNGTDGRTRTLFLTKAGRQRRKTILKNRREKLEFTVDLLTEQEQKQLTGILEKILREMVMNAMDTFSICRLCEMERCPMDRCPVEQEYDRLTAS